MEECQIRRWWSVWPRYRAWAKARKELRAERNGWCPDEQPHVRVSETLFYPYGGDYTLTKCCRCGAR